MGLASSLLDSLAACTHIAHGLLLEVLIRESPKPEDFESAFTRWMARINKTLATYKRVAVEKQEGQIASTVNSLVRQTELAKVATSACSLVVAAGILLTTLGVGVLME